MKHSVIGIRTYQWTNEEEVLHKRLLEYFACDSIFIVVDEINKKEVKFPDYVNKIVLNEEFLDSEGILSSHLTQKGIGWLCGDYFYYALREKVDSKFYWLIEPDVGFTFDSLSKFFIRFEECDDDALVQSFQKAPEDWMWKNPAELISPQGYKSFFPLTRLSKRAIDDCKKARKLLTEQLKKNKFDINQYPNDEALVATVIGNNELLSIKNLRTFFPKSFKYFTYMQNISVFPKANEILPLNQVLHPVRDINYASNILVKKLEKELFSSTEISDFLQKFLISSDDYEDFSKEVLRKSQNILIQMLERNESSFKNYRLILEKVLDLYPNLSDNSHVWIWKDKVLVLDYSFLDNIFTLEFDFSKENLVCNVFTRKGNINLIFLINQSKKNIKNNKIEVFAEPIGDIRLSIDKGVSYFYSLIRDFY